MASELAKTITTMALNELILKDGESLALIKFFGCVVDELTDAELNRVNTKLVDKVVALKEAA